MTNDDVTLLLAEDDPGHARLFIKSVKRAGVPYPILHFLDGQALLDYLMGLGDYAGRVLPATPIILLDLNMPRLNGVQVLERLRIHPALDAIPRIIITTSDEPDDLHRCDAFGYAGYLVKPVDYSDLAALLQVVLNPTAG